MQNRKQSGRSVTIPVGVLWGTVVSMLGTLLGAGIAAKMVDAGIMRQNGIGYATLVTLLMSAFLGATVAVKKIKHQLIVVCLISGIAYFLVLLSITALFFGGQYEAVGVTALLIFGGSFLAAMTAIHSKRGGKHGKTWKVNG